MKEGILTVEYDSFKKREKLDETCEKYEKRENEDAYIVDEDAGVFVIADGCTRHHGKYASQEASTFVANELRRLAEHPPSDGQGHPFRHYMRDALELANQKLIMYGTRNKLEPLPATTLDAVVLRENNTLYFAHVGDSSIYTVKNGKAEKLTKDQSVMAEKREKNGLDEDQAKALYADSSSPTNFLGMLNFQRKDIEAESMPGAQRIVMVTDGLTNVCTSQELKDLLVNYSGRKLIEKAFQIYTRPHQIFEVYLRENRQSIVDLITAQTDAKFIEIQKALIPLGALEEKFAKIDDYMNHSTNFKKMVYNSFMEKHGQGDDFTIIVIELGAGLKFRIKKTFGIR